MTDAQFSIALRFGARKALREGAIDRNQFKLVRGVLREPVRQSTEYGTVNILAAVRDFVTAMMLDGEPEEFPTFDIITLITFIIANMDEIMAFIQMIIDLFN